MVASECVKLNDRLVYVKNEMSPRRRKAEDVDVFAALVRVMLRRGPAELTLRAIASEAGVTAARAGAALWLQASAAARARAVMPPPPATSASAPRSTPGRLRRSRRCVPSRRFMRCWRSRLAPRCGISPTCRTTWRIRCCGVTCCGSSGRRGLSCEQLLADAVSAGELRRDTDVRTLARMIEVTLDGSFLAWTLYREGSAAERLRDDLESTLRPYLVRGVKRKRSRR